MLAVLPRRTVAAALTTAALLASAPSALADEQSVPGTAGATTLSGTPEPARPAFYEPPTAIEGEPGTILRQQKADNVLDPLDVASVDYDARRVMYASRDREGRPIAVTGFVVSPRRAWTGPGRRPIISYAAGTQGMADNCSPSRQIQQMTEYETIFFKDLLLRGYTVALTDYQGLGTPGTHTYMVREAQAHAVLDLARAVQRIGIEGTTTDNPVGLSGYSQGGGAAAAAAELAGTYAPDLDVKGTAAGAVPADLSDAVPRNIDGGGNAGLELYAAIGLFAGYHVDPARFLNDKGLALLPKVEGSCVLQTGRFGYTKSATLTRDGRPLHESFADEPLRSILADNKIGNIKPSAPVLLTHSVTDDIIPYKVGRELAISWCAQGAKVRFQPLLTPTHVGGAAPTSTYARWFFDAQFAGRPLLTNCGAY